MDITLKRSNKYFLKTIFHISESNTITLVFFILYLHEVNIWRTRYFYKNTLTQLNTCRIKFVTVFSFFLLFFCLVLIFTLSSSVTYYYYNSCSRQRKAVTPTHVSTRFTYLISRIYSMHHHQLA